MKKKIQFDEQKSDVHTKPTFKTNCIKKKEIYKVEDIKNKQINKIVKIPI